MAKSNKNKRKLAREIKDHTNKIQILKEIQRRSSVAKNILLREREILIDDLTSAVDEESSLSSSSKSNKKTNNLKKVKLLK